MDPITLGLAAPILAILVLVWIIWRKGRPVAPGEVFRTSRLSAGHKLFPTQVIITPNSVVHHTPQWIGRHEHSIHIAHVASVSIDTGMIFSDVIIETTGGTGSIRCRGHRKADAIRMKQLIETHQTAYYRGSAASAAAGPGPALPPS